MRHPGFVLAGATLAALLLDAWGEQANNPNASDDASQQAGGLELEYRLNRLWCTKQVVDVRR